MTDVADRELHQLVDDLVAAHRLSQLQAEAQRGSRYRPSKPGHKKDGMGLTDWNWLLAADPQDYAWDCSACSTAWAMRTIGLAVSEQDVIAGLGPSRISPSLGLLDASGAGLVSYLGEMGISAANNPDASWQEVMDAAGYQPMVIGGRAWGHWVAVRMGSDATGHPEYETLLLMNPSGGYKGIGQYLTRADFDPLGPFSAVWFVSW